MDPFTLAAAGIGAAANLGGSFLSAGAANANAAAQRQIASDNINEQNLMATMGLRFRAADATAAENMTGINRLTMLGVQGPQFSPVQLGDVGGGGAALGAGVAGAGQDIARAVAASSSVVQRQADLDAKLTEAKIANVNADTINTTLQASRARVASAPGTPPGISGTIPLYQTAVDDSGRRVLIPSEKAASPLQTLASTPLNLSMAVRQLGDIGRNTWEQIKRNNDVLGLRDGRGVPGLVLPDVFRHTDNVQAQWFGGM